MAIKIYAYSNPYEIDREPYWNEIKDCPHFCVSQTMVNGLTDKDVYPYLRDKQSLTTVRILLDKLYNEWENPNTKIQQMMEVDNAIHRLELDNNSEGLKNSLEYNSKSIVSAIRLFKELNIDVSKISTENITSDQKILIDIYKIILERQHSSFDFNRVDNAEQIQTGIEEALKKKHNELNISTLKTDTIIFHGIHQFSPAMLCAIEDISRFKTVVLLFNYQEQYKAAYQTWMNIYSLFNISITNSTTSQFVPTSLMVDSYSSNVLADSMGNLANGVFKSPGAALDNLEVIEFANMTEFAGYCANIFEEASMLKAREPKSKKPSLTYMREQMYSASGRVNDILRSYFPEQFGERHFLDYPIGHFFVSAVELWDSSEYRVKIHDFSNIKECLSAGIIPESNHGKLLNSFNIIEPAISKEIYLDSIIKCLVNLRKLIRLNDGKFKRISYLNIAESDLKELIEALKSLNEIIVWFFEDFNEGKDNFQKFYNRIHDFIVSKIQDQSDLDDEMKEIVKKLVERLENTDLPDTGTFVCLKQTLSYYLSQDDSAGRSANWIVRDFEQIDGDILRSQGQSSNPNPPTYHFCCLSDKDITAARDERLPWPLDIKFFETAYEPLDWKYQVFLKSKMEFRNFKRYALLYGLEFNRLSCKLSYIKTENSRDNELYHMLSILGIKVTKYHSETKSVYVPRLKSEDVSTPDYTFTDVDYLRYNMCPYKFAVETAVQNGTIYRDRFHIIWYMRMLLQNAVINKLQSKPCSDAALRKIIAEQYTVIDNDFKIANELEKTQIIAGVYSTLSKRKLNNVNPYCEDFLVTATKEINQNKDLDLLTVIQTERSYWTRFNKDCKYCASRGVCLATIK